MRPLPPNQSQPAHTLGTPRTTDSKLNPGANPVAPVPNSDRKLGGLDCNQTQGKAVGDRKTEGAEAQPIVGKNEPKDDDNLDGLEPDQLDKMQENKLAEVAKVSERYEKFSLMGRAKSAIDNPLNAPKDLKVKVTLPGKDSITIIPWTAEIEKLSNINELREIATTVLEQYEKEHFETYNQDEDRQLLESLKNSLRTIAEKLGDNKYDEGDRGGFENTWEKRFNEVRLKPVRIDVFDNRNDSDKPKVTVVKPSVVPQEVRQDQEQG